jgi:hypothetical protein
MWPSKRKLDQETSKHIGLAQQNGSSLAFFQRVVRQVKGPAEPNTCYC